ncbi:MAG TPA: hypothetical protein PKL96_04610 [Bacteroidales bacterium]|nr:hypothetical protein [Bacteroidales bacterium]HPS26788.1 hypothetical protein [Bacteroidales bacterium]
MFKFLKKDSLWFGVVLALVVSGATFGVLYLLNNTVLVNPQNNDQSVFKLSTLYILSLVPNAILLRWYLVNLKADKTGRGILLVTFIFAVVFMIIYYKY